MLGKSFQYFNENMADSLHCSLPWYEVFYGYFSVYGKNGCLHGVRNPKVTPAAIVQGCGDDPTSTIDIGAFLDWRRYAKTSVGGGLYLITGCLIHKAYASSLYVLGRIAFKNELYLSLFSGIRMSSTIA